MHVTDVRSLAACVRQHSNNAVLVVDNSCMSPVLMRPLQLGADIVVHACTSYVGGSYSESQAGVIAFRDDRSGVAPVSLQSSSTSSSSSIHTNNTDSHQCVVARMKTQLRTAHCAPGAALGALDSLLLLQELRTLAVRVAASQQNAQHVSRFLQSHPHINRVHYLDAFLGAGSRDQRVQFSQVR